jgi:hypothetical protein
MNKKINPMKVYCKKCYSGLKLITIYENSNSVVIKEVDLAVC